MIGYREYNSFVRRFVKNIGERAKGIDETSERFVEVRPRDQILAGFLTPLPFPELSLDPDYQGFDDLPQDSAYEQTSIGIEWEAVIPEQIDQLQISIETSFQIYVRRVPTYLEQVENGTTQLGPDGSRFQRPVQVWSRHASGPLCVTIPLSRLLEGGKVKESLNEKLRPMFETMPAENLFVWKKEPKFTLEHLKEESTYLETVKNKNSQDFIDELGSTLNPVVDVRCQSTVYDPNRVRISVRIINASGPANGDGEVLDLNLYGVNLRVDFPKHLLSPMEFRQLPKSYRYDRRLMVSGINAQAQFLEEVERYVVLAETVPATESYRLEPREIVDEARPRFDRLSEDPIPVLKLILAEMESFDKSEWSSRIATIADPTEIAEAHDDNCRFKQEIECFRKAIGLLSDSKYSILLNAFKLMNLSMLRVAKTSGNAFDSWRLFQIVFIVSRITELASRQFPEIGIGEDGLVDVLWFAAGGGKTEAFLGLVIWQAFFDRLRGKKVGVTAFIRFPLRLLTFQQLSRLGKTLGQAELVRLEKGIGGQPFSMGFYVGRSVTPNSIDEEWHRRLSQMETPPKSWRILSDCTYCGGPVRLHYDSENRMVKHCCDSPICPGSKGLPVYVVDQDIYRFVPTVIVSTVDKMAQFGQNQRFGNLLGRFDQFCATHGASFRGNSNSRGFSPCKAASDYENKPDSCGGHPVSYGPFIDPGPSLLIQDELHLLSEELGTFDAHYETAICQASRALGFQPWKVIAATATIENYQDHAWHLYLRKARQFPAPGPKAFESFYYAANPEKIGRVYLGAIGVGRKHTPSVTKMLTLVYMELQEARKLAEIDLSRALRRYDLNSMTKEEFSNLLFLYELPLVYVLTRKGSDQVAEAIESRVKKELVEAEPEHGELIIDLFNGGVDIETMMEAMNRIKTVDPSSTSPEERIRGLVTTNIIGHGVDVNRFNIIVFAGFTRLVAEYIQASARVGRTYPGISIFVATPQSERDRSIFDRFEKFHEYLDRLVDPSAVNRWPIRALEKTLPGLLAGYIMTVASALGGARLSTVEAVKDMYLATGVEPEFLNKEAIAEWMYQALGARHAPDPEAYMKAIFGTTVRLINSIISSEIRGSSPFYHPLNTFLGAMKSLRDVDEPGYIFCRGDSASVLRRVIGG